jgi:hypothetical protein
LSPVDVITSIRKELAEFQRTSNSQAFRERLRAELRKACKEALYRTGGDSSTRPDYLDVGQLVEYLETRGLIRSESRRAKKAAKMAAKAANGHLA